MKTQDKKRKFGTFKEAVANKSEGFTNIIFDTKNNEYFTGCDNTEMLIWGFRIGKCTQFKLLDENGEAKEVRMLEAKVSEENKSKQPCIKNYLHQ